MYRTFQWSVKMLLLFSKYQSKNYIIDRNERHEDSSNKDVKSRVYYVVKRTVINSRRLTLKSSHKSGESDVLDNKI